MSLSGAQQRKIQEALLDAYSLEELRIMVKVVLDKDLDEIVARANLRVMTFTLVEWADENGQLGKLISGALKETPGNIALQKLNDEWFSNTEQPQVSKTMSPEVQETDFTSKSRLLSHRFSPRRVTGVVIVGLIMLLVLGALWAVKTVGDFQIAQVAKTQSATAEAIRTSASIPLLSPTSHQNVQPTEASGIANVEHSASVETSTPTFLEPSPTQPLLAGTATLPPTAMPTAVSPANSTPVNIAANMETQSTITASSTPLLAPTKTVSSNSCATTRTDKPCIAIDPVPPISRNGTRRITGTVTYPSNESAIRTDPYLVALYIYLRGTWYALPDTTDHVTRVDAVGAWSVSVGDEPFTQLAVVLLRSSDKEILDEIAAQGSLTDDLLEALRRKALDSRRISTPTQS